MQSTWRHFDRTIWCGHIKSDHKRGQSHRVSLLFNAAQIPHVQCGQCELFCASWCGLTIHTWSCGVGQSTHHKCGVLHVCFLRVYPASAVAVAFAGNMTMKIQHSKVDSKLSMYHRDQGPPFYSKSPRNGCKKQSRKRAALKPTTHRAGLPAPLPTPCWKGLAETH